MSNIDMFFQEIESKTGIKKVKNKPYGHLRCKPNSLITLDVKKNIVQIGFATDGYDNWLSSDVLITWANDSGILREEYLPNKYFKLERGKKNKNKTMVIAEVPYEGGNTLISADYLGSVVSIINQIKNYLHQSNIVVPVTDNSSIEEIQDAIVLNFNMNFYELEEYFKSGAQYDELPEKLGTYESCYNPDDTSLNQAAFDVSKFIQSFIAEIDSRFDDQTGEMILYAESNKPQVFVKEISELNSIEDLNILYSVSKDIGINEIDRVLLDVSGKMDIGFWALIPFSGEKNCVVQQYDFGEYEEGYFSKNHDTEYVITVSSGEEYMQEWVRQIRSAEKVEGMLSVKKSINFSNDTKEISMTMSNDITVRFPLKNGEGEIPDISQFSEDELLDLRSCLSLSICWEPEQMDENQEARITSIEILYDGITHIEDEDYGYWFEDDELYGYPAPVVRFHLDQDVNVEQFRTSIFTTSYKLTTESIEENDDEPFYAADHNGYTSILSEDERDELREYYKSNGVFCGKTFSFPQGLEESGYSISGTGFILTSSDT